MKEKFVSIIIPCREIDKYTEECIDGCLKLNYKNYEIIVLPDNQKKIKIKNKRLRIFNSGKVKPAIKRNVGMSIAKGEIYAFIDSDAVPEKNWLRNAVKYFGDKEIGMVGGPNLTPKDANLMEQVSGEILAMPICSGLANVRYRIAKKQYVKELPSCNFVVKKQYADNFDSNFLTAEDSKFCFSIEKKGKKILYAPNVIVYHHRRNSLEGHVKQMYIYGRDIAMLTKKEFSIDKLYFTLPSLFVLFSVIGFLEGIMNRFSLFYSSIMLIYSVIILTFSLRKNIEKTILIFFGVILTHFSYGIGFIAGLFKKPEKTGLNKR